MKTSRKQSGFAVMVLLLTVTVGGGLYALGKSAMTSKTQLDATFTEAERVMNDPTYDPVTGDPFEQYRDQQYAAAQQTGAKGIKVGLKAVLAPLPGAGVGAGAVQLSDKLFGKAGDLDAELTKVKQEAADPNFSPHRVTPPPSGDTGDGTGAPDASSADTSDTGGEGDGLPTAVGEGTCGIAGGTALMTVRKEGNTVFAWLRMSDETLAETQYNSWQCFYYPVWYLNNAGEGKYFGTGGAVDIEASCTGQGVIGGGRQKIGYLGVVSGAEGRYSWGADHTWETTGSGQYTVTFYVKGAAVGSVSTP